MKLFPSRPLSDSSKVDGVTSFRIPPYLYLALSQRQRMAAIREVLEIWFSKYPEGLNRNDVHKRFIDKDQTNHYSAFFELLLHELVLSLGFSSILPNTGAGAAKAPDFNILMPSGNNVFLEATIRIDCPARLLEADSKVKDVMDVLNKVHSPDFFFVINQSGAPSDNKFAKQIKNEIQSFVDSQDYDVIVNNMENTGDQALPRQEFYYSGWYLDLTLYPKGDLRGKTDIPSLLVWSPSLPSMTINEAIWSALKDKANRYKAIDAPFVLALNLPRSICIGHEVFDTLYGAVNADGTSMDNGAWHAREPNSSRVWFRKVSGLLIFHAVEPCNFASSTEWVFVRNPNARYPIPDEFVEKLPVLSRPCSFLYLPSVPSLNEIIRSIPAQWPRD